MPVFLADLVDAGLGHVEVLLEHKLPHSPMRVDVVLCGTHPCTGESTFVMVELKQWSHAELLAADLVLLDAHTQPVLHPAEQVRRYCEYVVDETPALEDRPHAVHGIAYLHNSLGDRVPSLRRYTPSQFARLYTMDEKAELLAHLRALLDPAGERDAAGRGTRR
ncbi:hypothetical protein SAMN05421810_107268 [Amycolatopsis arida]|uniref:PD-(D/E)XK nuclease superfamily protein n=1 Tax=Amycolatopsis arida TaxID=587909 RepID=A0A1I5YM17_9PSEU|nr:hypothetical protein [Amycolatopsis arida]TDX90621.1 hypothetical protein CLV69_107268 [Amycolatopsis arida]SFQ45324.1 hypothetical protein SAMN05421810_107268 [Amycolatopsis arida]